jgi:hypothetical protein
LGSACCACSACTPALAHWHAHALNLPSPLTTHHSLPAKSRILALLHSFSSFRRAKRSERLHGCIDSGISSPLVTMPCSLLPSTSSTRQSQRGQSRTLGPIDRSAADGAAHLARKSSDEWIEPEQSSSEFAEFCRSQMAASGICSHLASPRGNGARSASRVACHVRYCTVLVFVRAHEWRWHGTAQYSTVLWELPYCTATVCTPYYSTESTALRLLGQAFSSFLRVFLAAFVPPVQSGPCKGQSSTAV